LRFPQPSPLALLFFPLGWAEPTQGSTSKSSHSLVPTQQSPPPDPISCASAAWQDALKAAACGRRQQLSLWLCLPDMTNVVRKPIYFPSPHPSASSLLTLISSPPIKCNQISVICSLLLNYVCYVLQPGADARRVCGVSRLDKSLRLI